MSYTGLPCMVLTALSVPVYYLVPKRFRYLVLLLASAVFYYSALGRRLQAVLFFLTIAGSYAAALLIEKAQTPQKKRLIGRLSAILCLLPLLLPKLGELISSSGGGDMISSAAGRADWIIPLGLSFYTLQIIAYLIDVSRGKVKAQRHFLKYALFISFFPQIIQGPIPRYETLFPQLSEGNDFDFDRFRKGLMLIIWAFFLKLVIADRAAVAVSGIFDHDRMYPGLFVLVGGVLYSLQLYVDFLSCTTISQGISALFGIRLDDNFARPYFSVSVQEFWRRWHMTLSRWLRDYVYIPLGGSRKGNVRRMSNLMITFLVSGLWHGNGLQFLLWGMYHGLCQIGGQLTLTLRQKWHRLIGLDENSFSCRFYRTLITCFLVMLGWVMFRANSARSGLTMIGSLFTVFNPWIFFDGSLMQIGLSGSDWTILGFSAAVLALVSLAQEHLSHLSSAKKPVCLRDLILKQHVTLQWLICVGAILFIWIFGVYGYGFDAKAFIYGSF